jgi:hypothetical protein
MAVDSVHGDDVVGIVLGLQVKDEGRVPDDPQSRGSK